MQNKTGFKISDVIGLICVMIGAGVLIRTACFVMSEDIWFDELFTVELALKPMGEMISLAARDVHPPLYYILVRLVYIILHRLFGTGVVAAAKITSLIPYVFAVIYLLTYIRRRYGLLSSGLALLLIETMPHMSEYMVEARMYSWCAFTLLAMYVHASEYVRRIDLPAPASGTEGTVPMSGRRAVMEVACVMIYGLASMYLHYYGFIGAALIALGTLGRAVVLMRRGELITGRGGNPVEEHPILTMVICMVAAIAAYIPWIHVLSRQIEQVSENYWIQPVSFRTLLGCVKYVFKPGFESDAVSYLCAVVMIAGFIWFIVRYIRNQTENERGRDSRIAIVICTLALPAGLAISGLIASKLIRPVFVYRYLFPSMFVFWTGAGVMAADEITRLIHPSGNRSGKPVVRIVTACLICVVIASYIAAGVRSFNLFRWEESRKSDGMERCAEVFDEISRKYPDTLIVCNFNQMQAILWFYLDNDSLLWGHTDETLIAEICDRAPIVMTDDLSQLIGEVKARGQNEFLFVGSGNARDEIIAGWESCGIFTELLQDSCFLERYYANIYKVGFER